MQNFQGIVFIWTQTYTEIFKSDISKEASLIDNLNWKVYSERELLRITAALEPIVITYEQCL